METDRKTSQKIYRRYMVKCMTPAEIAIDLGLDVATVVRVLTSYGIEV